MRWLPAVTLLSVLTTTLPAFAQQPRVHDGVHLRGAFGLGYGADSAKRDLATGSTEGTVGGLALSGELSAGYALFPGGILGAGFYFNHIPTPRAKDIDWVTPDGPLHFNEVEFDHGGYWMLGPMFDYYPTPDGGFHASLALGYAIFGLGNAETSIRIGGTDMPFHPDTDQQGGGLSAALGVGYDFWVADVLSLGVLARFMIARGSAEDSENAEWTHTVYSPALMLSASFD